MAQQYFISICVPAYKRTNFLVRLLDSLVIQDFRDFEVVISDDSPGVEVSALCAKYEHSLPEIRYFKNTVPLGTPANWNMSISKAEGKWIKLMHDDDWFSRPDSLHQFAQLAKEDNADFIFCSYINVFLETESEKVMHPPSRRMHQLKLVPATLLSRNIVGPPSVVLHRNDRLHAYDPKLKWLVDVDMYIRRLPGTTFRHITLPLIKVGVGNEQVTTFTHGVPEVEIPEHFYFIHKLDISSLRNILVYDYWWRFIRNFKLRKIEQIRDYGVNEEVPSIIVKMIRAQRFIPVFVLRIGVFSKIFMFLHYILYRKP